MPTLLTISLMFAILYLGGPSRKAGVDNVPVERIQSVQTGTWGGAGIRLDVRKKGARTEFDCAVGTVDEPLKLDRSGRFDLKGTVVMGQGGPVRENQEARRLPARYAGRVEGRSMTLTVTLTDSGQTLGTFTLRRGTSAKLTRCQ